MLGWSLSFLALFSAAQAAVPDAVGRYTFDSAACDTARFTNLFRPTDAAATLIVSSSSSSSSSDDPPAREQIACGVRQSPGVALNATTTAADAAVLVSQGSVQSLLQPIQAAGAGFTLELWFRTPDDNNNNQVWQPIVTIGTGSQDAAALSYCDSVGIDFQLGQRGNVLELYYRTSDQFFEPCQRFRILNRPLPLPGQLAHVVISLADKKQQVFVNGRASDVLEQPFANNLAHWDTSASTSSSKLHVLAYGGSVWMGRLYQMSLYPAALDAVGARERLVYGLPLTVPYTVDSTVRLNEDAEPMAGSHSAVWYSQVQAVEDASRISLPIQWLDQDVRDLLESLGLQGPQSANSVYVYLTQLPTTGRVYLPNENFRAIDLESSESRMGGLLVPVVIDGDAAQVVYLPPRNEYSNETDDVFATISYCITTFPIFNPSQCNPSTINVIVDPVNDPPLAFSVEPVTVMEGIETATTPKILLTGIDVDIGDAVARVQVTQPPIHGKLILSVSSFRQDDILHGTSLSSLGYALDTTDQDQVHVKYLWDPASSTAPVVQGNFVRDSFSFRVADQAGLWSTEKAVVMNIGTALTAIPQVDFSAREDSREQMNLRWHGKDASGFQRRIGYFVESVPGPSVGILVDATTQQPIKAGTMVETFEDFPYDAGVAVSFIPSPNYCNSHKTDTGTDALLQFRAVAVREQDGRVVSASDIVTQPIRVECLIDSLTLTGPTGPFTAKQVGLRRAGTDPCRGAIFDPAVTDLSICTAAVVVNGIDVVSMDQHVERAHVTVLSGKGYLTFNEQSWHLVRSVHGRRAVAASNVTFLANPEDLADVFSHLHFESYLQGPDTVDILIQYGNCSHLPANRSTAPFQTSDCQFLRHTIEVTVEQDDPVQKTTQLVMGFPWQILLCLIGYPVAYYALIQAGASWQRGWGQQEDDATVSAAREEDDGLDVPTPDWVQQKNPDTGEFYYQNSVTGNSTWLAPVGQAYLRWTEPEEEKSEL